MIAISLKDFLGAYILGSDRPNGGHALFRTRQLREPGAVLATHRAYTIATCSEPGSVVAVHEGQIVGAVTRDSIWVDPPHRGQGLATELHVQRWLLLGRDGWMRDRPVKLVVTPGGHRTRLASYRALVARGIVGEP
jgi:GNAT superfamily N-acetyltransferase